MGIVGGQLDELAAAAHLHDIGKLAVPRHVVHLPRALNEQEQQAMATHPERGYRMLFDRVPRRVAEAVRSHHEWYDGRGYPYGRGGTEIPLHARIISVADAVDAIISDRPYDPARPMEEAEAEMMAGAGTQFDPRVVDALLAATASRRVLAA
jgi:HD-GYP domain-containing protein (c-di-GMP phosphodiesterase class II)